MTSIWLSPRRPVVTDEIGEGRVHDVVVGAGLTGLVTALLLARAGRDVLVLEAREPGAVTTGHSTAKISLLQSTRCTQLLRRHSEEVVRAYVDANREGQEWLLRFCSERDVPAVRRAAVTYAPDPHAGLRQARAEYEAARLLGLGVRWSDDLPVPFPTHGGVVLADQAQVDPVQVVEALVADLRSHGGRVVTEARVTGVSGTSPHTVRCADGRRVDCETVVLATGAPILDRGLHFARLVPERSYALAFEHPSPPEMMLISAAGPTRSIRDARVDGTDLLLIGGEGHVVGRTRSERQHLARLRQWTGQSFPGAIEVAHWSAQDYRSHDGLPIIGTVPGGSDRIHVATGFAKWGMTNGVAAALAITSRIIGASVPWAEVLRGRPVNATALKGIASINARVVAAGARQVVTATGRALDGITPAEGEGVVGRDGIAPTAVSTVDGHTCALAAACTHLGGIVEWNDAEQTWDCPLHGSRFSSSGEVLEGPATHPLRPRRTSD